jgi:membrane associated rhomboid family serine protease
MKCPECDADLERAKWQGDVAFECRDCGGFAVPLATLQRAAQPEFFAALQRQSQESVAGPAVACPACRRQTRRLFVPSNALRIELDVCRWCRLVWFDPAELQQVPTRPRVAPDPATIAAARRALAIEQVREETERSRSTRDSDPDHLSFWQQLLVFVGLPVEETSLPRERHPWLTWSVAAALVVAWLASLADPRAAIVRYGFVPAEPWRVGGLTLFTSFFVHAGFFHLLGNFWFLLLAGDDVEERLGRWWWAALLIASTLAGHLLHALFEARSELPSVGASGGIAGLLACYAVLWPDRRIVIRVPRLWRYRWWWRTRYEWHPPFATISAAGLFALWAFVQCFLAWLQVYGAGSISGLAHLGGAAVGLVAGFAVRARDRAISSSSE